MQSVLYYFVYWLGTILTGAVLIRVLLSWFSAGGYASGPVVRLLDDITEPILGPLRRVIPPLGMFDLSPIVAIVLIQFIQNLLQSKIRAH
jgi:YggT family protein